MANETTTGKDNPKLICLRCDKARFPDPKAQCYKFGGLICSVDNANVDKYQECRFESEQSVVSRQ
jgi:hypothetical protein